MCLSGYNFSFINIYTAKYRISANSISKNINNNAALMAYNIISNLPNCINLNINYKEKKLRYLAPAALMQAIKNKQFNTALVIYFSKWHRNKIFSLGGGNRVLQFLSSYLMIHINKK